MGKGMDVTSDVMAMQRAKRASEIQSQVVTKKSLTMLKSDLIISLLDLPSLPTNNNTLTICIIKGLHLGLLSYPS